MKPNNLIFFLIFAAIMYFSCNNEKYITIHGATQGTSYKITYNYDKNLNAAIDSILKEMDLIFSTFNSNSVIEKINNNIAVEVDDHFVEVFNKAMEISKNSGGLFDITVGPLVEAYGFGSGGRIPNLTDQQIDSLKQFIGYEKIRIENGKVIKDNPNIHIDMNAIAQGYTVDQVGRYFDKLGIKNYYIEIGGEVLIKGHNEYGEAWRIGVEKPIENTTETENPIQLVLQIKNERKAVATSGNYRRFYVENGVKFTHTINPQTGRPVKDSLLSVTILANDCTTADGYATACLVSGFKKGVELVNKLNNIEGFFIYLDKNGVYRFFYTPGFKKYIVE